MQHDFYKASECNCEEDASCPVCQGLAICKVCGGAEGSLPSECPGVKMNGDQQDAVYAGTLDYHGGMWVHGSRWLTYQRGG